MLMRNSKLRRAIRQLVSTSVLAVTAVAVIAILVSIAYSLPWTGFGELPKLPEGVQRARTLWDWLQLVGIPSVVAVVALWFNQRREKLERELAKDRSQEESLQKYIDRMTELLLEKGLHTSEPEAEVRKIARARTLTVLRELNGERKAILLRFLHESGLITKEKSVVYLSGADLSGAKLSRAYLHDIDLSNTNLREADLTKANLGNANLNGADLRGANLTETYLDLADLRKADLTMADLEATILFEADLEGANLTRARLHKAVLQGASLPKAKLNYASLVNANLGGTYPDDPIRRLAWPTGADLTEGDLSDADLSEANLQGVQLCRAILKRTNLRKVNLSGADLREAQITAEQLAQAASLERAILPDGNKHE